MRALVALGVVGALLRPGHADVLDLPRTKATIDIPKAWTVVPHPELVAAYQHDGVVVAVSRAQVPNPDAWRPKTRDAYLAEIERGALAAVPRQKRASRKQHLLHGVPVLDLELDRADGSRVVMRTLVFRTYALSASVLVPKARRGALGEARAIATSLVPPGE